jgi:signal transduction histidine kinase
LADWQVEALEDIDRATTRLAELTEDLLDVSRIQAGKLKLHLEPTDLVALVQRVVKRLQVTVEQHILALSTTEEHLIVQADPKRMEQVLTNLINNAIKYSPEGGKVDIVIRADQKARTAVLCVRDTGIGIPLAQQAQIFGRFVRADNARGIGGTGLGLYLCREIVERHEGHIWFESVEGQGSTFYIDLPLVLDPYRDRGGAINQVK